MKRIDVEVDGRARVVHLTIQEGLALPVRVDLPFPVLKGIVGRILLQEARGVDVADAPAGQLVTDPIPPVDPAPAPVVLQVDPERRRP